MVRSLLGRLVSAALLLIVGAGGGGLPILDTVVFHGPDRLAEAFRPHYEASSASCHGDSCSVRSLTQTRPLGDDSPPVLLADPLELLTSISAAQPVLGRNGTLRYLSRAPPPSV